MQRGTHFLDIFGGPDSGDGWWCRSSQEPRRSGLQESLDLRSSWVHLLLRNTNQREDRIKLEESSLQHLGLRKKMHWRHLVFEDHFLLTVWRLENPEGALCTDDGQDQQVKKREVIAQRTCWDEVQGPGPPRWKPGYLIRMPSGWDPRADHIERLRVSWRSRNWEELTHSRSVQ